MPDGDEFPKRLRRLYRPAFDQWRSGRDPSRVGDLLAQAIAAQWNQLGECRVDPFLDAIARRDIGYVEQLRRHGVGFASYRQALADTAAAAAFSGELIDRHELTRRALERLLHAQFFDIAATVGDGTAFTDPIAIARMRDACIARVPLASLAGALADGTRAPAIRRSQPKKRTALLLGEPIDQAVARLALR